MQFRLMTYAVQFAIIIAIIIGGIALGGIVGGVIAVSLWALFGMWKIRRMNRDPEQQQLINLLVSAADTYQQDPLRTAMTLNAYFGQQGWSRVESGKRMAHAMSFIEHSPSLCDVYPKAQVVWRDFVGGNW